MRAALNDRPEGLADRRIVGSADCPIRPSVHPPIRQLTMSLCTPVQPSYRAFEGITRGGFVRAARNHVVERHGDIRAERPLDLRGSLGGEATARTVDVTLELDAVIVDPARALERKDLESSGIGEQRALPR